MKFLVIFVAIASVCSAAPSAILSPLVGGVGVVGPQVGPAVVAGAATGAVKVSGPVAGPALVTGAVAAPSAVVGSVAGPTVVSEPGLGSVIVGKFLLQNYQALPNFNIPKVPTPIETSYRSSINCTVIERT
nr:PREDICTED: dirigent protein 10-like [Megachile rotundata]